MPNPQIPFWILRSLEHKCRWSRPSKELQGTLHKAHTSQGYQRRASLDSVDSSLLNSNICQTWAIPKQTFCTGPQEHWTEPIPKHILIFITNGPQGRLQLPSVSKHVRTHQAAVHSVRPWARPWARPFIHFLSFNLHVLLDRNYYL